MASGPGETAGLLPFAQRSRINGQMNGLSIKRLTEFHATIAENMTNSEQHSSIRLHFTKVLIAHRLSYPSFG